LPLEDALVALPLVFFTKNLGKESSPAAIQSVVTRGACMGKANFWTIFAAKFMGIPVFPVVLGLRQPYFFVEPPTSSIMLVFYHSH
jgi:hypothetical protein